MKMKKKLIIMLLATMMIIVMASCGNTTEKKVIGSWYDENMNELFLSEDGAFSLDDIGGTYAVDGNRITMTSEMGSSYTYEYIDDEGEPYLYDTEGDWHFYSYDVASEMYYEHQAELENQRVSTVDAIGDYFVGTWVSDGNNPLHDYVISIKDDNTFEVVSDDAYYEDNSHAGLAGTWEFVQDWNDQRYLFKATYKYPGKEKTFEQEEAFVIPDWEDKDLDKIEITIGDCRLHKESN